MGPVSEDAEGGKHDLEVPRSIVFQWGRVSEDAEGGEDYPPAAEILALIFQWGRVSEDAEGRRWYADRSSIESTCFQWGRVSEDAEGLLSLPQGVAAARFSMGPRL